MKGAEGEEGGWKRGRGETQKKERDGRKREEEERAG